MQETYKFNEPSTFEELLQQLITRPTVTKLFEMHFMLEVENGITMKWDRLFTTGEKECNRQRRTIHPFGMDQQRSY